MKSSIYPETLDLENDSEILCVISNQSRNEKPVGSYKSTKGAGFTTKKSMHVPNPQHTKPYLMGQEIIVAQNTRKNSNTRENIMSVNIRWKKMMDSEIFEPNETRRIKFDEIVKCHKIPRIEDIASEFDEDSLLLDRAILEIMDEEPWYFIKKKPKDVDSISSLEPGYRTPPIKRKTETKENRVKLSSAESETTLTEEPFWRKMWLKVVSIFQKRKTYPIV